VRALGIALGVGAAYVSSVLRWRRSLGIASVAVGALALALAALG
jgi:hypothetical protein